MECLTGGVRLDTDDLLVLRQVTGAAASSSSQVCLLSSLRPRLEAAKLIRKGSSVSLPVKNRELLCLAAGLCELIMAPLINEDCGEAEGAGRMLWTMANYLLSLDQSAALNHNAATETAVTVINHG